MAENSVLNISVGIALMTLSMPVSCHAGGSREHAGKLFVFATLSSGSEFQQTQLSKPSTVACAGDVRTPSIEGSHAPALRSFGTDPAYKRRGAYQPLQQPRP
jgi:hypothetical protein